MRCPIVRGLILLLALLAAVLPGCSSKDNRYPEDHARFVKIDKTVEALRTAYVRKDLSDIQGLMLPKEALEKVVLDMQQDFSTFQEISLDWTLDRVLIEAETIDVVVNWAGQWRKTPADQGFHERGQGVLKLAGEKTILLNGLDGDLPFGMATRRAGSEPPRPGQP